MTITLTTEELLDYQKRMERWASSMYATEVVERASQSLPQWDRFSSPWEAVKAKLQEDLKKNPMPKLIPKEIE